MQSLSWLAALALSLAVPAPNGGAGSARDGRTPQGGSSGEPANPSPTKQSAPTKRGEDRPAHESPYSAFGAPHAKRARAKKRPGPRVHCKDGSIQTVGQKGDRSAVCSEHGGVKEQK